MKMDAVEDVKRELSRHNSRLFIAQEKLNHFLVEQTTYADQVAEKMAKGCPASELVFIQENKSYYNEQIHITREVIRRIEGEIEETRLKLAEAMKEQKIYEKLKENAEAQYMEEILHAENKVIEEIVNYKNFNDKNKGDA